MVGVVAMTDEHAWRSFGVEVRRLRQAQGLSLVKLSQRCGVTPNYIGNIENGHRQPHLSTMLTLARGLGVPLGEILGPFTQLSKRGREMARLFDALSPELQAGILQVLRNAPRGPRK
jgi:transcriptional regulator with XRE-family HTH domain